MNERELLSEIFAESALFKDITPEFISSLSPQSGSLPKGSLLFCEGDPAPWAYVISRGILGLYNGELLTSTPFFKKVVQGDLVGEYGLLCQEPRSASAVALTDVEYLRFDRDDLQRLLSHHPELQTRFIRSLAQAASVGRESASLPLNTIVLFNAHPGAELTSKALSLLPAHLVDQARGREDLPVPEQLQELDAEENLHRQLTEATRSRELRIVVLSDPGALSRRNLMLTDRLILLCDGAAPDGRFPELIEDKAILVRLWPQGQLRPHSQPWSSGERLQQVVNIRPDDPLHMDRLARVVLRTANVLVLGGGGAKGFAHVGAIKAMEELGLRDIDMVLGVSIGSLVASLLAFGLDAAAILENLVRVIIRSKPYGFTFPRASLFSLAKSQREIQAFFSPAQIQDSWLALQCFSTNLSTNRLQTWKLGDIATAVVASMSVPGIFPAVRDQKGELHVDGGILNNLPIRVARGLSDGRIIAISLNTESEPPPLGHAPARLPPLTRTIIASMTCASQAETKAQEPLADLVLKPDTSRYSFLEWKRYKEIYAVGYELASSDPELTALSTPVAAPW